MIEATVKVAMAAFKISIRVHTHYYPYCTSSCAHQTDSGEHIRIQRRQDDIIKAAVKVAMAAFKISIRVHAHYPYCRHVCTLHVLYCCSGDIHTRSLLMITYTGGRSRLLLCCCTPHSVQRARHQPPHLIMHLHPAAAHLLVQQQQQQQQQQHQQQQLCCHQQNALNRQR